MRSWICLPTIMIALSAGVALSACLVDPAPLPSPSSQSTTGTAPATSNTIIPPPTGLTPGQAAIATGSTLESNAGRGAGVFVEYEGKGSWHVWASCDTAVTGLGCNYRVFLTPGANASLGQPIATDLPDSANTHSVSMVANSVEAHFALTNQLDGVAIQVNPPGASLEVTAWIDANPDPRILYWSDLNVIHQGAPSDPMVFLPTSPLSAMN